MSDNFKTLILSSQILLLIRPATLKGYLGNLKWMQIEHTTPLISIERLSLALNFRGDIFPIRLFGFFRSIINAKNSTFAIRFHAGGTVGRHRHHWRPRRPPLAGCSSRS